MAYIVYPKDLPNTGQPNITFLARDKSGSSSHVVTIYAPPSITVSDGAGYGNFDLGVIGSTINNTLGGDDKLFNENSAIDQIRAAAEAAKISNKATLGALELAAIGSATGSSIANKISGVALNKQRIAINPNTVLQFTGPDLRSFGFSFTLVSTNTEQSDQIKEIVDGFRERMYPEKSGGDFVLEYPDTFAILFNLGPKSFVPNFAESYLTSMSTTYNSSGNSYHEDGTPTDVTIQLQFSEFRALSRNDVKEQHKGNIVIIDKT